jgi:hypothetical protein
MSQQQRNDDMNKQSGQTPGQDPSRQGAPGMGSQSGQRSDSQGQDQHTSGRQQESQDQNTGGRQGSQDQRNQGQQSDRSRSGSDYLQGGDQGRGGSAMDDDSRDMDVDLGSEDMNKSLGKDRDSNLGMGRSDSGRDSSRDMGRDQGQTDNRRDQDSNI